MKTNSTQQEILLLTGTSFATRQWSEKGDDSNPKHLSEKEQLEQACWNGLLPEMLPEIFEDANPKDLHLWQVKEGTSFLELEMGKFPETKDHYFSIDPYAFMATQWYN